MNVHNLLGLSIDKWCENTAQQTWYYSGWKCKINFVISSAVPSTKEYWNDT
jgi:hypothetical protein